MATKPSYPLFLIILIKRTLIRCTYISAAETKVAKQLRRYLVSECGLPNQSVTSMDYWRQGKANG